MTMTLSQLAARIGVHVHGDGTREVDACAPIQDAGERHVTFLANVRYVRFLETTRAAAVLVAPDIDVPAHVTRLVSDDPYFAFRNAMIELTGFREHPPPHDAPDGKISPMASVHPDATIGAGVTLHPFVSVAAGARVGDGTVLYPGVSIGAGASVGGDCLLYPNVVVYDRCTVGDRVILHSGTVIGHDGFGHATHAGVHHKIPQTGIAVVEDDVEMGAGCVIERAAMGETRIGAGTKMADLISIGHGATVGQGCLLVSLVGIGGSTTLGRYVVMGGQSGVVGHRSVGDGVQLAARTLVTGDVEPGRRLAGMPAIDIGASHRNSVVSTKLHDLAQRLRALERRVEKQGD